MSQPSNTEQAHQMRASRRPSPGTLPSERNGVIYQPRSNTFLCNGWGCAHPADMRAGFYYPLTRAQIKQLRRAAAAAELRAREKGKGTSWGFPGVFVSSYAQSAAKFIKCLKRARKYRKGLRKELAYQRRANVTEAGNIGVLLRNHKFELLNAKETRYTLSFPNRLP